MADTVIDLTKQPTLPHSVGLNKGQWSFINNRLQANAIGHSSETGGYIRFNAVAGAVKAVIGVSSETSYDMMRVHVTTSPTPPTSGSWNMGNISGSMGGTHVYNITTPGIYYLHFKYSKDGSGVGGEDTAWITSVTLPLDTSATAIFFDQYVTIPDNVTLNKGSWVNGSYGLQSNAIGSNVQTSGYIKFDATAGEVKAYAGVSSESGYDFMSVHLSTSATPPGRNGGNMANYSGKQEGVSTYNITTPGTYYLHFYYAKDGSGVGGLDIGWINYVILPIADNGTVYTNVSGVWKKGTQYANVSGVWKKGATYSNVNGVWKIGQ